MQERTGAFAPTSSECAETDNVRQVRDLGSTSPDGAVEGHLARETSSPPPTGLEPPSTAEEILAWCIDKKKWAFTPLQGKRPTRPGWQKEAPLPARELLAYKTTNFGLRTGSTSGVVVVDIDTMEDVGLDLPETVEVKTGKGKHLYYAWTGGPLSGKVRRIHDHVDVRAEGNQVVFPGSIHPDTKTVYAFVEGKTPWELELAPLPQWIADACAKKKAEAPPPPPPDAVVNDAYAAMALCGEVARVERAGEGERNHALNRAAFALGQLVGGGMLDADTVFSKLSHAGQSVGLSAGECAATIKSGMTAGRKEPRKPPPKMPGPKPKAKGKGKPNVMVPGSQLAEDGGVIEVSVDEFVGEVARNLPGDSVYEVGGTPLWMTGERGARTLKVVKPDNMRYIIDQYVRLFKWVKRNGQDELVDTFISCSSNLAALVLNNLVAQGHVRPIVGIYRYPVMLPGWTWAEKGWNKGGIYYDPTPELELAKPVHFDHDQYDVGYYGPIPGIAAFEDVFVDFPFAGKADKENFMSALLTPMMAPAMRGNRPMFFATATMARTGKSKLMQEVVGGILLGRQTPSMQWSEREEECDKRIVSMLRSGQTLVCLDNIPDKLDSASLASLLTGENYSGRLLGGNDISDARNLLTVYGTGNNTRFTEEMAKRVVPVCLESKDESPESRTGFRHPDLYGYCLEQRTHLIGCLMGMVEMGRMYEPMAWMKAKMPPPKGGFEGWSEAMERIACHQNMTAWRSNEATWLGRVDDNTEEKKAFVLLWAEKFGSDLVTAGQLVAMIDKTELLGQVLDKTTVHGQRCAMGRYLKSALGAPTAGYIIDSRQARAGKEYVLHTQPDTTR